MGQNCFMEEVKALQTAVMLPRWHPSIKLLPCDVQLVNLMLEFGPGQFLVTHCVLEAHCEPPI